jgi:hypothetical protein
VLSDRTDRKGESWISCCPVVGGDDKESRDIPEATPQESALEPQCKNSRICAVDATKNANGNTRIRYFDSM